MMGDVCGKVDAEKKCKKGFSRPSALIPMQLFAIEVEVSSECSQQGLEEG